MAAQLGGDTGDARYPAQLIEYILTGLIKSLATEHCNRDGHLLETLQAPLRSDHYFLDPVPRYLSSLLRIGVPHFVRAASFGCSSRGSDESEAMSGGLGSCARSARD